MTISTHQSEIQYSVQDLLLDIHEEKKSIKVCNVYVNSKSTCRLRVAVVLYVVCTKLCWQTYVSKAWVQTS